MFYILQVDAIKLREQDRIYLYAGTNYSVTGNMAQPEQSVLVMYVDQ